MDEVLFFTGATYFFFKNIFLYLMSILPASLCSVECQVISSSLLALATLLDVLIGVQSEKPAAEDSNIQSTKGSKAQVMAISSAKTLFVSHHYFLDFLKSESPAVRSATYAVLRSFIKNIGDVFSEEDVKGLATAILGAFQEKDPSCHTALWETFLLFSRRFSGSWSYINFQKTFSNRFWQFLKNGCFGSQQVSYPALVLLLDVLPAEVIGGQKYFVDFFQHLWLGRNASHPTNADRLAFLAALKECFRWVLHNCGRYVFSLVIVLCGRGQFSLLAFCIARWASSIKRRSV